MKTDTANKFWDSNLCFSFCIFPHSCLPLKQVTGSVLPCHTGSLWQEIVSSPFPLLRSVSQKPKLVGEVLLTASGNKRWCECFYYNQSREQVPLTATIGEKRETPPLPQAEKIGSSLANVPERRGYVSPCLTKEPLFQTQSGVAGHPFLRITWSWWMIF